MMLNLSPIFICLLWNRFDFRRGSLGSIEGSYEGAKWYNAVASMKPDIGEAVNIIKVKSLCVISEHQHTVQRVARN